MGATYDFSGYVTKNDLQCSDGRIIRHDAFKSCDGQTVPLVWQHVHTDPMNVLGNVLLENRDDGVYGYGSFNETDAANNAKLLLAHGDINAMSIYANQLKQQGPNVIHGTIREVSLVLAGANPGAFIETIAFEHSAEGEEPEEAIIYSGEDLSLAHAEAEAEAKEEKKEEAKPMAEEKKADKTVQEVFDELTEEQKNVVYALIGQAIEDTKKEISENEGENEVKHNVFDNEEQNGANVLSHADMQAIFADAKKCGSLKEAVDNALEGGVLMHAIDTTGMEVATGTQTYGVNDASMLFPDPKSLNTPPEWIGRNMDWVQKVMGGVHHTPFSRIKSTYANITEDEARAKGYIKGNEKKTEVFSTLKRTTSPQTIYKLQKMDRDDILDITDFDVVAWIKGEMKMMLQEEKARAILIGDGRLDDADDKISEEHVRPIVNDVPLFNIKHAVEVPGDATPAEVAEAILDEAVRARKQYKGSGNPTFFTTEDVLTEALLLKDGIGHKLYKSEAEVATAMRVREIVTVEPMEGHQIEVGATKYDLIGVIVNLNDYNVGADRGGQDTMFDDFDIDFNQYKYLIEGRMSGALVKPYSAITLYKKVSN